VADEPEPAPHAGPLWPVIEGLLDKDPAARLDAAGAERMLSPIASAGAPETAPPVPPAETAPHAPPAGAAEATTAVQAGGQGRRAGSRSRKARAIVLAAVAAIAVVAAGIAMALDRHPDHSGARPAPPAASRSGPSTTPSTAPPSTPSPASSAPAGSASASSGSSTLPAGYYRFTNATGFSIGVPRGWRISHEGHYVYIRDPANSGIFLLIDQSDQPKSNPLADWRQQAADRQGSYPGYHLILLREVRYTQAEKAADWEFTYDRNGVMVQVLNRNILANARHAYALYWSTPVSEWDASYHYFQAFAATFRPAAAG